MTDNVFGPCDPRANPRDEFNMGMAYAVHVAHGQLMPRLRRCVRVLNATKRTGRLDLVLDLLTEVVEEMRAHDE